MSKEENSQPILSQPKVEKYNPTEIEQVTDVLLKFLEEKEFQSAFFPIELNVLSGTNFLIKGMLTKEHRSFIPRQGANFDLDIYFYYQTDQGLVKVETGLINFSGRIEKMKDSEIEVKANYKNLTWQGSSPKVSNITDILAIIDEAFCHAVVRYTHTKVKRIVETKSEKIVDSLTRRGGFTQTIQVSNPESLNRYEKDFG